MYTVQTGDVRTVTHFCCVSFSPLNYNTDFELYNDKDLKVLTNSFDKRVVIIGYIIMSASKLLIPVNSFML